MEGPLLQHYLQKKKFYRLIKVEIFFDFAKSECKTAPVVELIDMRKSFETKLDDTTKIYLKRLIKKIFALDTIEEKYKEEIKKLYSAFFPDINY